jgi:hypothetical protein
MNLQRANYNHKSEEKVFTATKDKIQRSAKNKEDRDQKILNDMLSVTLEQNKEEKENQGIASFG